MDDARIQQVTQAVVDANYDMALAAGKLGITPEVLDSEITGNRQLRKTCIKGKNEVAPVNQGRNFRGSLKRAGIEESSLNFHMERTRLFNEHGSLLLSLVTSNAVTAFIQAMELLPVVQARVAGDDYSEDEFGVAMRGQDHDLMVHLIKLGLANSANLQQVMLTLAKVKKMQKDGNGDKQMKHAQPAWKPLAAPEDVVA